jgi:hypothetical protein
VTGDDVALVVISNVLYVAWWLHNLYWKHFVYPGCCRYDA